MRLTIILLAIVLVLVIAVSWQYFDHDGMLTILAILTGAYIIIRGIHALGGRGGTVSIVDVFLLSYAVGFWAFLIHYWWDVTVGASVLVAVGVLFVFLYLVLNSELVRRAMGGGVKRLFAGRYT